MYFGLELVVCVSLLGGSPIVTNTCVTEVPAYRFETKEQCARVGSILRGMLHAELTEPFTRRRILSGTHANPPTCSERRESAAQTAAQKAKKR